MFYFVIEAIILYAAPIWYEAGTLGLVRRRLKATQKMALIGAARAYRTISADALCALTSMPPIHLIVRER